jgi:hypothetical protein
MSSSHIISRGIKSGIRPGIVQGIGSWWQQFPRTQAEGVAWAGVTFDHGYLFDAPSGNAIDLFGAVDLAANGTMERAVGTPWAGRLGSRWAENAASRFQGQAGSVFDLDDATSIAIVTVHAQLHASTTVRQVVGKSGVATAPGYRAEISSSPLAQLRIHDGTTQAISIVNGDHRGVPMTMAHVIDRDAAEVQEHTLLGSASASISAIGSLSNAAIFRLGGFSGAFAAAATSVAMYIALSANAEGKDWAAVLRRIWRDV